MHTYVRYCLRVVLLCMILLSILSAASSCNKEPDIHSNTTPHINVELYDINSAYRVRVLVTHDGTNRDRYLGILKKGNSTDCSSAIESYLSSHSAEEIIRNSFDQKKRIIDIGGLLPGTTYTYIVCRVDDNGNPCGDPSAVVFTTIGKSITFTVNPNWDIVYKGQAENNDFTYSLNTVLVGTEMDERYFIVVEPEETLMQYGSVTDFLLHAIDEFVEENDFVRNPDLILDSDKLRLSSTNFYKYLQPGRYQTFVIGMNIDGSPTGHYATSDVYEVMPYELTDEYTALISKLWTVYDATGHDFMVLFEQVYANSYMNMRGWGGWIEAPILVRYSMANKSLTIKPQYIPDITEFSSDGETFQGSMYFNGWYENENGNVKLITQLSFADVLVDGKLQEDGSYVIENDFISESNLSTDVESGKFGVVLQFKMDSKYVYFNKSLMQFPITLKL